MKLQKKLLILIILIALSFLVFRMPMISYFLKTSLLLRRMDLVKHFAFSEDNSLEGWDEKIFKGHSKYNIEKEGEESYISASSREAASALYHPIKLDMRQKPILSWRWKAGKFPLKHNPEEIKNRDQDDFVARVYVIFPSLSFTRWRALEYIWAENIEEGTIESSPYSDNLKLIVAESGRNENGGWKSEARDVYEDYVKAFGEEPKLNIGAIAIMTDADSTGSSAQAFYDDIKIGYK